MRVTVTGATGLIGRRVVDALRERGDEVTTLSRSRDVVWARPKDEPPPADALAGRDAVINLLGENVSQRWSDAAKREIRDSRVLGTRQLVAGIAALPEADRPKALVSGSAIGYYGARGDERVDESEPPGGRDDFLASVVIEWEAEARKAEELGLRVAIARTGVVLAEGGGALDKMLPPFKLGVGGPVAGGRQYVPWVHVDDVAAALVFLAERGEGVYNVTAPEPVTNRDLSKALGRALHRPAVAPVPAAALKLLYGEMGQIVTTGVRAVPKRLLDAGYSFRRPDLDDALRAAVA